jgi:hypothetical protein
MNHTFGISLRLEVFNKIGHIIGVYPCQSSRSKDSIITIAKKDRFGTLISSRSYPMHSFVQNTLKLLYNGSGLVSINPTTLIATSGSSYSTQLYYVTAAAASGITSHGIMVGTGTNDVAISDYSLQNIISNGSGIGQLNYAGCYFTSNPALISSDSISQISAFREISNNSSSTITIREVGLAVKDTLSSYCFLLTRDRIDGNGGDVNLSLQPNESAEIRYSLYVNSGSGFTNGFLEMLLSCFKYNTSVTYHATDGSVPLETIGLAQTFRLDTAKEDSSFGLVFGTDADALDLTSINLGGTIAHGESSGKLYYYSQECYPPTVIGNTTYYELMRAATNNSGGTIIVEEIGLINFAGSKRCLTARLLTGGVTLADTESCRARLIINTLV